MFKAVLLFLALASATCLIHAAAGAGLGTLRVASDISYAPIEFYAPKNHEIVGLDYDLAQELARHMGSKFTFTNHDFATILPALRSGSIDIVMSAVSDSRAREKQADFIDYFLAGSGILVAKGNPAHIFGLGDLCGRTVDLQKGTSQEVLLKAQSAKCADVHLAPIKMLMFATDLEAFKQISSGNPTPTFPIFRLLPTLQKRLSAAGALRSSGGSWASYRTASR